MVTIEDLVEEIVGDIQDEYDREEILYEKINENEYVFDAKIGIDEFNELMDTDLGDEDYDTLGGFLYAQLDKIPIAGDAITYKNMIFTVLANRGRRITKVRVQNIDTQDISPEPIQQTREQRGPLLLPPVRNRDESDVQNETGTPSNSRYEIKEA